MNAPIQNLVVVGRDAPVWLAACVMQTALGPAGLRVSVVELPDALGAADAFATLPALEPLHTRLRIDETRLIAATRGAFTLAITDSDSTPLARRAERVLLAPIDAESFAGSYVGPLAAINALLVGCAHANPERTLALLKPTEAEYRDGLRWYREPAQDRRRAKKGNE